MGKIAVIGATGFIGKHLIEQLLRSSNHELRALSRSEFKHISPRVKWYQCDLFSVLQIEKALEGVDTIVYLVHSMQPSAKLDQANFADYDLILADNLGRAARKYNIKRVIYLGGLLPQTHQLSAHLKSRYEVESVLKEYIPEYTFLRAGLILGGLGSSFNMLLNLVKRLKVMICPLWTQNQTSPVLVEHVIKTIVATIDDHNSYKKIYDLGAKDSVSYMQMMKYVAKKLKVKRFFIPISGSFLLLSRLWVSLISGASRKLVYPLVESLKYSLLPRKTHRYVLSDYDLYSVEEAIEKSVNESKHIDYQFSKRVIKRKTVRSVQRSIMPDHFSGEDVAQEYMKWLPRFLFPFIIVKVENDFVTFSLLFSKVKLLILEYSPNRSSVDRQIFYIKGGLLATKQDRGRLEFREVLNKKYALSAIHDFRPALPWYIYRYTQAVVHLIVMKAFGRHLKRIQEGEKAWIQKY